MIAAGELLDAGGPEQIRAAFDAAVATTLDYVEELTGIAAVLSEAADTFEIQNMAATTLAHLRDGAHSFTAATAALTTAQDKLHAAQTDFGAHDGRVGDVVAETGNLMHPEGYTTSFTLTGDPGASVNHTAHTSAPAPNDRGSGGPFLGDVNAGADAAAEQEKPMNREQTALARRGTYHRDQPRAADGTWVKVGDALGYADDETCYATDRVTGTGPVATDLALIEYPPEPGNQSGAFVSVATPKGSFNPVTGSEGDGHVYCAPQLDPGEAETAAGRLEELAGMVESGFRPPTPTVHTRARQRIELLLQEDRAASRQRIMVGEEDDFPLTTGQLLKLLTEADPTLSAPPTRHAVRAHAAVRAGGEDGTVWLDIEPDATGQMHVVVTAVEGTESPDDEFNRQYAAQHTPESARELAGKLRAFARAARRRGGGTDG